MYAPQPQPLFKFRLLEIGGSRARGFPFVRIEPGQYGLVWQRCVPTEAKWLASAELTSRQTDAFVDQYGVWDPDGGLADDEMPPIGSLGRRGLG